MTADGRLIASQAASDTHSYMLLEKYGEFGKTTPFKYEVGALCATFPEMVSIPPNHDCDTNDTDSLMTQTLIPKNFVQ